MIEKAEKKWWSRLLKQEGKPPVFVKVDWDKWVEEDEETENKCEFSLSILPFFCWQVFVEEAFLPRHSNAQLAMI